MYVAAVLLCLIAIALPAGTSAEWLAGADAERTGVLTAGLWILKGMLALHAVLLVAAARVRGRMRSGEPLLRESALAPGRATRADWAAVLALTAVAALLRLYALNDGLWYDEITTLVKYVRRPFVQLLTVYDSQNQHLLYSLLARVSFLVFGDSGWALRLPAVLFGVASLPALYWFGTQVAPRREALLATVLLTVSYHHVWFSQNARGYTGLLFWTLLSSGLFLRLLQRRTPSGWSLPLAYAGVIAAAMYTHLSAVFVAVAHGVLWLILLLRHRERPAMDARWLPAGALVLSATLTLLVYALVLPQVVEAVTRPAMGGVETAWKHPLWFVAEAARGLTRGLPGGWLVLAGGLAVGLAGLTSWWRRSPAVTMLMTLPGIVTAIAIVATGHNLWPRFFFFCAGFALLIAVRGVYAAGELVLAPRLRWLATAALLLLVLGSALTVPRAWRPKQDFAGAMRYIERTREPGDAVVMLDLVRFPYQRYLEPGWLTADSAAELEAIERGHRRTFVVYIFPTRLSALQPEVWARIRRLYTEAAEFPGTLGGGEITVMVRG